MPAVRSACAALLAAAAVTVVASPGASAARLRIPTAADELVVVSSSSADPPGLQSIATLRAYVRSDRSRRWRLVFGPWAVETGSGHLIPAARRREGDHATPTGVFGFGHTIYGIRPDPGGLHYRYRRLVCGDWWDEDPYSALYNHFVQLSCGASPGFGGDSEALWTESLAYPYFALIDFNVGPTRGGAQAPGSAIFLHSWVADATAGCVALPLSRLLAVLRWLRPAAHPAIEIGTEAELASLRAAARS
jgi:L,D-peptidoglycan transpeptidase YkuD (ErfK/YbiS/YcfS/YnhG family)